MAFLLAGSQIVQSPGKDSTRINQLTQGDRSAAIAGVSGNVTIINNAEPSDGPPVSIITAASDVRAGPLALTTNPALQGLLLDQRTHGNLSPALAAIGGSVVIEDRSRHAKSVKPK